MTVKFFVSKLKLTVDTLTSQGVECLLRLKSVQVTQINADTLPEYLRLSMFFYYLPTQIETVSFILYYIIISRIYLLALIKD